MKKILICIVAALCTVSLFSCESKRDEAESKEKPTEEVIENTIETADTETRSETQVFDFSSVSVEKKNAVVLNIGDSFETEFIKDGASFYSSRPSVVSVDNRGNLNAVSEGVSLVVFDFPDDKADCCYAVCVLPEEAKRSSSANSPSACEAGTEEFASFGNAKESVIISNEKVMHFENGKLVFDEPGYTELTVTSASVPHMYSYVVFDRVVQ